MKIGKFYHSNSKPNFDNNIKDKKNEINKNILISKNENENLNYISEEKIQNSKIYENGNINEISKYIISNCEEKIENSKFYENENLNENSKNSFSEEKIENLKVFENENSKNDFSISEKNIKNSDYYENENFNEISKKFSKISNNFSENSKSEIDEIILDDIKINFITEEKKDKTYLVEIDESISLNFIY